jgi:hypothetical protein
LAKTAVLGAVVQAAPKAARPPSRRQRANPQYSLPVVYRSKVGGFEDAYRAANPLPPCQIWQLVATPVAFVSTILCAPRFRRLACRPLA